MVKEYQADALPPQLPSAPRRRTRWLQFMLLALIGAGVSATATSFLMSYWLRAGDAVTTTKLEEAGVAGPALFHDWPDAKPDVALVLSGEEHGYLQPCGCSKPQLGGLPRRWAFIQELKQKGWPVVPIDLGDIPDEAKRRGPQTMLKYTTSMEALKKIGYAAVGVGLHEMQMPLQEALGYYSLNNPTPRVLAANLRDRDTNFFGAIHAWEVAGTGNTSKVGIVSTVGPTVVKQVKDPSVRFDSNVEVLPRVLKEMEARQPELLVLLYQGTMEEAKACALKFPQFHVVLCLSKESEPPAQPDRIGETLLINVGHKGRYVGVVGAYRTNKPAQPFDLRYQLATLGEQYEAPKGKEDQNPIMVLMEEYAKQVKDGNYLAKYPQIKHPMQVAFPEATYVGSDACKSCHKESYKVWENTPHSHAYQTLVDATNPKNRQFDGECIVCHVVGFEYATGFRSDKATPDLVNVGCESCHGPGSEHIADRKKNNKQILALMNPYKTPEKEDPNSAEAKRRINMLDQSCQKCHDIDNDVHWNFEKKWPKIVHREAKKSD